MLEALVYNRLYEVGYNISFVKDLIICWTTKVTAEAVFREILSSKKGEILL